MRGKWIEAIVQRPRRTKLVEKHSAFMVTTKEKDTLAAIVAVEREGLGVTVNTVNHERRIKGAPLIRISQPLFMDHIVQLVGLLYTRA